MNENNQAALSFDRMRNMLTRAAEIRESEQQQIFDALDEIHARMSPLESLGSMRKRLSELPDRTEVSVLAERLDETLAKLENQDGAIAELNRAVDGLVDKLAQPFAQLDGRLDGVAGRFDGVAGRMDGLEDKLGHIHKRLDELGGHLDKQDDRIDALPGSVQGPVRERIDAMETSLSGRFAEIDEGMHEHLDGTRESVQRSVNEASENLRHSLTESTEAVQRSVGESTEAVQRSVSESSESLRSGVDESRDQLGGKLDELAQRPAVDPTDRLDQLSERLETLTTRLDQVSNRLDTVEEGVSNRVGDLGGTLSEELTRIGGKLADRPDSEAMSAMVRDANEESERRHAGQLDEAMATFAELILGGNPQQQSPPPPTTLPRQQQQQQRGRGRAKSAKRDSDKALPASEDSEQDYTAESA